MPIGIARSMRNDRSVVDLPSEDLERDREGGRTAG